MKKHGLADVVVVGAGVIGCAIARELAASGMSVTVVERHSPGRRATWAAAGMLSPLGEAGGGGPFLELGDLSLSRFPVFARTLRDETGIDVEYRTTGKLQVAIGDDEELRRAAESTYASRFGIRLLDGSEARDLEPDLSPAVTTALLIERDHRVNNRLLAQALLAAAKAAGATFRTASPATGIVSAGGSARGVRLASGEQIDGGRVVIAAGAWSGRIEGLPRPLPVRPVKGQMFAVDARTDLPGRSRAGGVRHVIFSSDCYIIPREDGRLLVGATVEDVGFRNGPTPRGIGSLMTAATAALPKIADLPLVETWAGFRPGTPDDLPIIGTDPAMGGLIYATGHFRNGILLTPITAECVARLVTGGEPPLPLDAFGIERFQTPM